MSINLLREACENLKAKYPDEMGHVLLMEDFSEASLPAGEVRVSAYKEAVRLFKHNVANNIEDKKLREFLYAVTELEPCITSMNTISSCHDIEDIGQDDSFIDWLDWILDVWPHGRAPFKYEGFEPYILDTNELDLICAYATLVRKERWPEGEVRIREIAPELFTPRYCIKFYPLWLEDYCEQFEVAVKEFRNV